MRVSKKYKSLFIRENGVNIYILTGGRFSAKSFASTSSVVSQVVNHDHRAICFRYSATSNSDSIIPAIENRISILGKDHLFKIQRDRFLLKNKKKIGKIVFKGLKAGSSKQTATQKSLEDISLIFIEEAEEIPDFETFDKLWKSIRPTDVEAMCILTLNPTTKEHWIYKHFFEDKGVQEGFNGINGNVQYIHTSWMDVEEEHIPKHILDEYKELDSNYKYYDSLSKDEQEFCDAAIKRKAIYYKHTILGGWKDKADGVIYDNWIIGEFPDYLPTVVGMDFGASDPNCACFVAVDRDKMEIYIDEIMYKSNCSTKLIHDLLVKETGYNTLIVADNASKQTIIDLRDTYKLNIRGCIKCKVEDEIRLLQKYKLVVTSRSKNVISSLNNYIWLDRVGAIPCHEWSHAPDSFRYGAMFFLKNQGNEVI